MKKIFFIIPILLTACTKPVPFYTYENTHILDKQLAAENTCVIILNNKTEYSKGTKKLDSNPFLGDEGFSAGVVEKIERPYDYAFINKKCENPIELTRKIQVSGIIYPGVCAEQVYAGSVYTGSTTRTTGYGSANLIGNTAFGSYTGTTNTFVNSIPVYNTHRYACIKENYLTEIEFYHNDEYVGAIRNKYWEEQNPDETIDKFTEEFLEIVSKPQK